MKKIIPGCILMAAVLFIGSCGNKEGDEKMEQPCPLSKEDSLKIKAWNKLFGEGQAMVKTAVFAREVDPDLARNCAIMYKNIYDPINCEAIGKAYTEGVSFWNDELQRWMLGLAERVDYSHIRIVFGVYTEEFVSANGMSNDKVGKLSIFIWPYKGNEEARTTVATTSRSVGEVAPPFNLGELHP